MIVPHQASPLFPYTTLFRSYNSVEGLAMVVRFRNRLSGLCVDLLLCAGPEYKTTTLALPWRNDWPRTLVARLLSNRKSTRLNSSHSQISYAVFCLKKKIPKINNPAVAGSGTAAFAVAPEPLPTVWPKWARHTP